MTSDFLYMKDGSGSLLYKNMKLFIFAIFWDTFSNLTTIRAGIWSKSVENAFLTPAQL